jgi:hypothetical protein
LLNNVSRLYCCVIIFSIITLLSLSSLYTIAVANGITADKKENDDDDDTNDQKDTMKLKIKVNLNNIDKNVQKLKLVSYVNGEVKEQYIDLLKDKSKINGNILVLNLFYGKSNDISSIIVTDQYFVCAYAVNDKILNLKNVSNVGVSFYDCDEGNIGSTDSNTAHLFYTLNKFNESVNYNKISGEGKNPLATEVKINVKVPLEDAKGDADKINVVGMIGGEYKVETINVEQALENQQDNNGDILDVPFVFNRTTEVGQIQLGDKFFGCVTGEELAPQHSHCEKRTLKDFEKGNQLYSRKDNNFK